MAEACNNNHHHHHLKKSPSWVCTLATQAALCLALYAALSIGRPQKLKGIPVILRREPLDLYFLSVRGGFWPSKQQTQLLLQMAKAVKIYNAKFVVNISERGEDDPLTQNATKHFPFLKIPWYTTSVSHVHGKENFLQRIKIPHGYVLDIIEMDTGLLQLNETESDQLRWLHRTLATSNSDWQLVVGFDSLVSCKEENAKKSVEFYEPLRDIFIKHGVDAYLSQQNCHGPFYLDDGLAFLGHPGPSNQDHTSPSVIGKPEVISEMTNGFLLHRVSPLEIESYFFKSTGKIFFKSVIHQRGREVM